MTEKTEIYKALAALVTYDPETGIITWNRREELTRGDKMFNKRFAGKECGRINTNGYRVICFHHEGNLHILKSHRLAWMIKYGILPDGDIDHVNRNRTDNRISNLRDVSRSINQRNSSMQRNNTSGVTGVSWHKTKGKWRATACVDGRDRHLGLFVSIQEAAVAVKAFRAKHGFTDSHGESA